MTDYEYELVLSAKAGNANAVAELVEMHLPRVRIIASRIRNCDWDDLLQEGRLAIIEAVRTFEPKLGKAFATHAVWRIRHRLWKLGRRQRRFAAEKCGEMRRSFTVIDEEVNATAAAKAAALELFKGRAVVAVRTALASLPRHHREILLASVAGEESYRKMGRRLHMGKTAVARRYHEALAALKQAFEKIICGEPKCAS